MDIKSAAAIMGKLGGKVGTGLKKVRGDSEYYKRIAILSKIKRAENKKKRHAAEEIERIKSIIVAKNKETKKNVSNILV